MQYTVIAKDGQEYTGLKLKEAKELAVKLKDQEPFIDEHDGEELTGVYYHFKDGKLVRVA